MLLDPADTRVVWLVVHTKPLQERVAESWLLGRGLTAYCPRILGPPSHPRAPRGPVPLFPTYLFSLARLSDGIEAVRFCPGARGLVRFGDHVAALEQREITLLKSREGTRGYLVVPKRVLSVGARARLVKGPLEGFEAIVDGYVASKNRVRVLFAVASGTWRAVVPVESVCPVEGDSR